jgi:hypothetical protein
MDLSALECGKTSHTAFESPMRKASSVPRTRAIHGIAANARVAKTVQHVTQPHLHHSKYVDGSKECLAYIKQVWQL